MGTLELRSSHLLQHFTMCESQQPTTPTSLNPETLRRSSSSHSLTTHRICLQPAAFVGCPMYASYLALPASLQQHRGLNKVGRLSIRFSHIMFDLAWEVYSEKERVSHSSENQSAPFRLYDSLYWLHPDYAPFFQAFSTETWVTRVSKQTSSKPRARE